MTDQRPRYHADEIRTFLPSGWRLASAEGTWDGKAGVLELTVLDGVGFDWPLRVSAREAAAHGRLGALERAVDAVFRHRLGRPTRGLGLAG